MEANYMLINREVDKEDVIHIQNGVLLSHKKEQNNANCSNMGGPHFTILSEASQRKVNNITHSGI